MFSDFALHMLDYAPWRTKRRRDGGDSVHSAGEIRACVFDAIMDYNLHELVTLLHKFLRGRSYLLHYTALPPFFAQLTVHSVSPSEEVRTPTC